MAEKGISSFPWLQSLSNSATPTKNSTPIETISLILPIFFISYITTNLESFNNLKNNARLILEVIAIGILAILNVTLLVDVSLLTTLFLIIICASLPYITSIRNQNGTITERRKESEVKFITNVRAVTMFLTTIVILAVDFNVFPERLMKRKKYGFSLMDLGVGLFMYSNGIVAAEVRTSSSTARVTDKSIKSILKVILSCIPLLVLGFGRLLVLKEIDYKVPVTEYGVHWNFFLTLAYTKLLSSLILLYIPVFYSFYVSLLIFIVHEILLQKGLAEFVFSNAARDNLISANREGIVSCTGYVGLYFLSVSIGQILWKTERAKFKRTLLFYTFSLLTAFLITNYYFRISRRLANVAYCLWSAFIGIFITTLFCFAESFQKIIYTNRKILNEITVPYLFEAINYNGLAYFLISNVLTGLVNMLFDTRKLSTTISIIILIIYMLITSFSIVFLYKHKIKLKL